MPGWERTIDNDNALALLKWLRLDMSVPPRALGKYCARCKGITRLNQGLSLSGLRATANNCQLCRMFLRWFERSGKGDQEDVHIVSGESALRIGPNGPSILRICSDFPRDRQVLGCRLSLPHIFRRNPDIQIGFPIVPVAPNPTYFKLLHAWLQQCDEDHGKECHGLSFRTLPTRVIDVGPPNSKSLRLHSSLKDEQGDYVVLSHCWGNLSLEAKQRFCTYSHNFEARSKGFNIDILPESFRDAVEITRALGKQYLWIDSLCIKQDEDDKSDWETESRRMDTVFALAYCTIAASSATNSKEGFLKRNSSSECIPIKSDSGKLLYVCEDVDNFEKDVEDAPLNKRAWVLQERALSRRILHFTKNQTYWECGAGVCSATGTRMRRYVRIQKLNRF